MRVVWLGIYRTHLDILSDSLSCIRVCHLNQSLIFLRLHFSFVFLSNAHVAFLFFNVENGGKRNWKKGKQEKKKKGPVEVYSVCCST